MLADSLFGTEPERLKKLAALGLEAPDAGESKNDNPSAGLFVEKPGDWIGPYKLLRTLGEGAMGIVYLAEQQRPIKRQVAVKVVKPGMDSKTVIARFEVEQQALALMDHPHIARVHDAGLTPSGRPYFVMELVEGIPITEYCDQHKLTIEDRLNLFRQVCLAVNHAHQKGIIHRDIKPSNILVSTQDDQAVPKIIDFGVAKALSMPLTDRTLATEDSQLLGTPEYMSPEQADMANQDIDTRSDIYSLGALLYVLLTGVLPFEPETLREGGIDHIRKVISEANPMTPSTRLTKLGKEAKKIARSRQTKLETLARRLHRELEWIPLQAMRKDRDRRYQSASELSDDIENYLRGDPLIAGPESTTYRAMKMIRKHRMPFAAGVITVASLVVGLVISSAMYFRVERARAETQTVSDFLQNSVLSSLNLRNVKSKEISVRSVLDKISDDLGVEFEGQPLFEASIRQTLVSAYGVLGLYKSAELHAKRAFEIHWTQLGSDNIATLYSGFQIGWVYMLQSRYSEAEPLLTEGLARFKLALDKDHPVRLYCMAFLGLVYNFQDRFSEAEELLTAGLNAAQSARDTEHPVERFLIYSLALTYRMQGRYQEAEKLCLRGLQISPQLHDEQDDDTLYLMHGLGALHWIMGHYDEAEETLQTVLEIRRELWGMKHPSTLHVMVDLGGVYQDQGRYEEAESQFTNALETLLQVLGEDHLYSLLCMHGLGAVYLSQNRYDKAETILNKILNTGHWKIGDENWITLGVKNTVANLYTKQERYEEAEDLFNKVIAGRIRRLGDDHPDTLETMNDLAVLHKEQARYEEAAELLLETLEGRRLKLGDTHPHTLGSWNNIIELYEAWDKPEKAEEWRAKLSQAKTVEE